jgi:hypothetical protein
MRNFICGATGDNCTDPRCKRGSCIMEQEVARVAVAKAVTKVTEVGTKAGRARRVDPMHARRVLFESARDMTFAQIRERLDSDREFFAHAWAVPEVRAEYRQIMKSRK